jgi:protein OS-9
MNVPPTRYLCSVPVLAPPMEPNRTATEIAKAEEARELTRASVRGWELMSDLNGQCLYFMSGWWSYSFCYGQQIVQFHALPNGIKGGPPVKDPQSDEYVLGRVHGDEASRHGKAGKQKKEEGVVAAAAAPAPGAPANTELLIKDNQRYLVQRLDKGTVCDLTGRERTIEVQYHCHPSAAGDRIGWIKEVTTCTYLMVVQTPRLCKDVAFLPPKETRAHPISCRAIVASDDDAARWHHMKTIEAKDKLAPPAKQKQQVNNAAAAHQHTGLSIGGVVVGARQVLGSGDDGKPAARVPPPRRFSGSGTGNTIVEVLARANSKADGGKVEVLSNEELEKLDLDPETVEELRKELERLAGDKGWKLEVVEVPGDVPEIRGIVEPDENDQQTDKLLQKQKKPKKDAGTGKGSSGGKLQRKEDDAEEEKGSEEVFFKEEL